MLTLQIYSIQTYVRTTLVNFPLLESIGFLIERQNRTTPSSLGYPFDGDQELREMDEVCNILESAQTKSHV